MKTALEQFTAAFKGETIKAKGTAAYWLTYAGPFFIIGIYLLAYYFKGHDMLPAKTDPWIPMVTRVWASASMVFLPMYLILLASQLLNLEHKNSAWRITYTLPYSKHVVFWSKFAMLLLLNASAVVLTMILTLGLGVTLSIIKPDLGFLVANIPWKVAAALMFKVLACTMGILSIYYYVSFEVKNQVKSIGVGIGLFIITIIVASWEYAYLIPTFYPMTSGSAYIETIAKHTSMFTLKEIVVVSSYFVVFMAVAWYRTCHKRAAA